MRTSLLVAWLLALTVAAKAGSPAAPAKGFWKILVTPKAKWVLADLEEDQDDSVTVETYDVRKVGNADVARLRWTNGHDDISERGGYPSQVAVTEAGLYLLQASEDDAAVAEALKKKPSRSDPPKPYKGTKLNGGRYLQIEQKAGKPVVCMGEGPMPGDGDCEDVCYGEMCVSGTAGVVSLEARWAPATGIYAQKGYH
jgi:hypothetical protein